MDNVIIKQILLRNGQKLILRKPIFSDAQVIVSYLNAVGGESDNLLYGKNEYHRNAEQEGEQIRRMNDNTNSFMILGLIDDNIVSIGQIFTPTRKRIAHNSDLYISVKKEYWGYGIGSLVLEEIINFAKDNEQIKNISLGVKANNIHAIKLYEKHGFIKVGVHKNYFNVNGFYDDKIMMDLYLN